MTVTGQSFGADVVVHAEVVRVLGKHDEEGLLFRQTASSRDSGRFTRHEWPTATDWPGSPVPVSWADASPDFDLSPTPGEDDLLVRLRRIIFRVPEVGVVVGPSVRRQEGRILRAANVSDADATLVGPGRMINLVEVALPPSSGRARIVLTHPRDLAQLPSRVEWAS